MRDRYARPRQQAVPGCDACMRAPPGIADKRASLGPAHGCRTQQPRLPAGTNVPGGRRTRSQPDYGDYDDDGSSRQQASAALVIRRRATHGGRPIQA